MPYVDVNFERNATIIKTTAKVSAGWDGSKPSHQFYGEEKLDYRLGFELRVAWMTARDLNSRVCRADNFPTELVGNYETRLFLHNFLNFPSCACVENEVTRSMNEENIEFHIEENDYFGTLATTLDLLTQAIEERGYRPEDADLLRRITDGLLYLQSHHTIQ
ncbi:MAG: hypothetical protein WA734_04575 [Candidatus Acidiferrales bacterium]